MEGLGTHQVDRGIAVIDEVLTGGSTTGRT